MMLPVIAAKQFQVHCALLCFTKTIKQKIDKKCLEEA